MQFIFKRNVYIYTYIFILLQMFFYRTLPITNCAIGNCSRSFFIGLEISEIDSSNEQNPQLLQTLTPHVPLRA